MNYFVCIWIIKSTCIHFQHAYVHEYMSKSVYVHVLALCLAVTILTLPYLCYGHKSSTGTVRRIFHQKIVRFYGARTAPGRRQEESYKFLNIFKTSYGSRWSLGTTSNSTAPVRRLVGSLRVKWHRPAFAHIGRAPDDFCIKKLSYDSNGARPGTVRCPAGHRTMSDKR